MFRPTIIALREVHMERVEEDSMKTEAGLHSEKKKIDRSRRRGNPLVLFPELTQPSLVVFSCFTRPVFIAETLTFCTAV